MIGPGSGTGVNVSTTNAGEVWQRELQRRCQEQTDPISYLFLHLFFLQIKGNLSFLQGEELSETWDGKSLKPCVTNKGLIQLNQVYVS